MLSSPKSSFFYVPVAILLVSLSYYLVFTFYPYQDLPQHLAFGTLLANFSSEYTAGIYVRNPYNSYHTIHYLLSFLIAGGIAPLIAMKIWLFVYHLLLGFALVYAASCIHEISLKKAFVRLIFLPVIMVNPSMGFGFLPYLGGLPFLLLSVGYLGKWIRLGKEHQLVLSWFFLLVPGVFHIVAGIFSLILWGIVLLIYGSKHHRKLLFLSIPAVVIFLWLGGVLSGTLSAGNGLEAVGTTIKKSFGFMFIDQWLELKWSSPTEIFTYVVQHLAGSFNLIPALALFILFIASFFSTRPKVLINDRKFIRFSWMLLILLILIPYEMDAFVHVSYINMRFLTFGLTLLFVLLPEEWLKYAKTRITMSVYNAIVMLALILATTGFQTEAKSVRDLYTQLPSKANLGAIIFDNDSRYFMNGVNVPHYLPVYYTVEKGGLCNQLWTYKEQFPLKYAQGIKPGSRPDWMPWMDSFNSLENLDYLIIATGGPADRREYEQILLNNYINRFRLIENIDNYYLLQLR